MKFLSYCLNEIDDAFLDEAELADIAAELAFRKRVKKYSAWAAAAASVGVAVAVTVFKVKRARRARALAA